MIFHNFAILYYFCTNLWGQRLLCPIAKIRVLMLNLADDCPICQKTISNT